MLYAGSGGSWHIPRGLRAGGSSVKAVYYAVGGAWRTVWSTFGATATGGDYTFNNGNSNTPRTRATAIGVVANPTGGSLNYSYSWSITGSSRVTSVSLSNPNSQICTVNATCSINSGGSVSVQCVVTDNVLGQSVTVRTGTSYNYYNTV